MKNIEKKTVALIDFFIGACMADHWDDSEIIDALLEIFTREDLEECGFGNFIKAYFDDEEE